jgi:hypothetical protein
MSEHPILPEEFNADSVTFTEPRKTKTKDGKNTTIRAYVQYDDKLRYWETPWLRAPFGVNSFEAKDGEPSNYALNISGRAVDPKDQPMVDNWFEQWKLVDKKFTDYVIENSKIACNGKVYKPSQREVVEALQTRAVKLGDADENGVPYPPRISPKISRDMDDPNRPAVAIYMNGEDDKDLKTFDELKAMVPKNSRVRLIIQPKVWFISGKFGISFRVFQIEVQPIGTTKLVGFSFSSKKPPVVTSAEDGNAEEGNTEGAAESTQVEDSGEEVEEVVEEDVEA